MQYANIAYAILGYAILRLGSRRKQPLLFIQFISRDCATLYSIVLVVTSLIIIKAVTVRRARLVLRWVTVRTYIVLVCNQPLGPTQLPILSGMENEYRPRDSGSDVRLAR